jgi:hypothetical protein
MTETTRRRTLWALTAVAAYVGGWALLAPAHWYATFPGAGLRWLPVLGPYNEHLAADVGGLYLALGVLSVGAARRSADTYLVRLTGLAWLVFSIPHLIYHLGHLAHYGPVDVAGNVVGLTGVVALAAVLVVPAKRSADSSPVRGSM